VYAPAERADITLPLFLNYTLQVQLLYITKKETSTYKHSFYSLKELKRRKDDEWCGVVACSADALVELSQQKLIPMGVTFL
jgi:hypothetical protein